jgi:hypothetical protein
VVPPDTQGVVMTFKEALAQVITWLQQDQRVSYRALKRQFALDDAALEDLQEALLYMYPQVRNDAGRGLVWTPAAPAVAAEATARFDAVLAAVTALLRCEGRITYRLLTLACSLDEALLEAVRRPRRGLGLDWCPVRRAALGITSRLSAGAPRRSPAPWPGVPRLVCTRPCARCAVHCGSRHLGR